MKLGTIHPVWPVDLLPSLEAYAKTRTLVVLDDDPTGTQTVRDVPVLTDWHAGTLQSALESGEPVIFVLTNSRSLNTSEAIAVATSVGITLRNAAAASGRPMSLVSRSDSTLRGHFPAEVDALADACGLDGARVLLAPYFGEGGRLTYGDVHYLLRHGEPVPVGETEFARDPVFGYRHSNLISWVHEKLGDSHRPIISLSLDTVRFGGPEAIAQMLCALPAHGICIANAVEDRDIDVVAVGAAMAEDAGVPLIARAAASYVRSRAGQSRQPLLALPLIHGGTPGLILVGSHVPLTTRQLARLLESPQPGPIRPIELPVNPLLQGGVAAQGIIAEAARRVEETLAGGITATLFTSRVVAEETTASASLSLAATISRGLVSVVDLVATRPAWLLAKGGITSSDVATGALRIRTARVVGQLLPGVSVWRCDPDSRWPDLDFVVFPGNVGDDESLRLAYERLGEAGGPK